MTPTAHKLGPGILKFGETGSEQEFSSQVTKCELNPSYSDAETTPVLSGDSYTDEGDWEGTLSGEFLQEYGAESLIAWCWQNRNKIVPFEFKPRSDQSIGFKGKVQVLPVTVGGDVRTANTTEFEWKITSEPEMTTGTAA